jgi:hypothetical protein
MEQYVASCRLWLAFKKLANALTRVAFRQDVDVIRLALVRGMALMISDWSSV